jgi:hypothetical protein
MTLHRSGVGVLILSFAVWTHASDVTKAIPPNTSPQFAAPELAPIATSVAPILMSQVRTCPRGRGRCGR